MGQFDFESEHSREHTASKPALEEQPSSTSFKWQHTSGPVLHKSFTEGSSIDSKLGSRVRDVDHKVSASMDADIIAEVPSHAAQLVMTASTEALCITGWQRFCGEAQHPESGPHRHDGHRNVFQQLTGRPAKVSAVHRQIVMINGPPSTHDAGGHQGSPFTPANSPAHEVCLELNIGGPGSYKSGFPLISAGRKKTLQDIHSEERSGFSKWQRPVADQPKQKHCSPSDVSTSGTSIWFEKLDCATDRASSETFCLGSNKTSTQCMYFDSESPAMANIPACDARGKTTNMAVVGTYATAGRTVPTSPFGIDRFTRHAEVQSRPSASPSACLHEATSKFMPNSLLLQAAFPSELYAMSSLLAANYSCFIKRPKLNSLQHPASRPLVRTETEIDGNNCPRVKLALRSEVPAYPHIDKLDHCIKLDGGDAYSLNAERSSSLVIPLHKQLPTGTDQCMQDVDSGTLHYHNHLISMPCSSKLLRSLQDNIPNVQEKSLVEFLHAKKHHKEHFLDKIIGKEDVYQSHPWHFTSGIEGAGACRSTAGGAAPAGGASSLYFCCSTKYTKRGNMTRNRMTREGGRWKQQGMVQPIFYGRAGEQQLVEAAHKTYLSYIPRGSSSCRATATSSSFFLNCMDGSRPAASCANLNDRQLIDVQTSSTAIDGSHSHYYNSGRLKHRHRMIEIVLQEDLLLEKRSFQLKITPKPFLVVCILRNSA
ncbi:hypothetical protein L7F22_012038 [Adiantum nelumboides]|nr:hypothetical protein [Adiantum nelumboides]MCO5558455.1 hypothetical protein [Adiantum nelumboides]